MSFDTSMKDFETVKSKISQIYATFSEDRKNISGIYRLTNAEIECDKDVSEQTVSDFKKQLYIHFADKEYNTEISNWKKQAAIDISCFTDISSVDIHLV